MTPEVTQSGVLRPPSAIGRIPRWLVVLALGQFLLVGATQVAPLVSRTWRVRFESALGRSARLSYGEEFAGYMLFLRQVIPEDALVVIPSQEEDSILGEMPFMQYFLFPRRLTNCPAGAPWPECVVHYTGPRTYLLVVGDFPPRQGLDGSREYLPFDDGRGVLAPSLE